MLPAHATLVRELEDALGARVEGAMHGVAEAWRLVTGVVDGPGEPVCDDGGVATGSDNCGGFLQQQRAQVGSAEHHRAASENPRCHGSLQRAWIRGQRHPRRDVRRHHPVLGDRDEEEVEEVDLLLGRLLPGEQQVEVGGERNVAHQLARQVATPHLDPVGVRLTDVADGVARLTDLHQPAPKRSRMSGTTSSGCG